MLLDQEGRGAIPGCELARDCQSNRSSSYDLVRMSIPTLVRWHIRPTTWVKSALCEREVEKDRILDGLIARLIAYANMSSQAIQGLASRAKALKDGRVRYP